MTKLTPSRTKKISRRAVLKTLGATALRLTRCRPARALYQQCRGGNANAPPADVAALRDQGNHRRL